MRSYFEKGKKRESGEWKPSVLVQLAGAEEDIFLLRLHGKTHCILNISTIK